MSEQGEVLATIRLFLQRSNRPAEVGLSTSMFAEGMGLDSLETAELSALLEDEHGSDPYSAGLMPSTVGEIVAFYDEAA